jgi:hypothetical protein
MISNTDYVLKCLTSGTCTGCINFACERERTLGLNGLIRLSANIVCLLNPLTLLPDAPYSAILLCLMPDDFVWCHLENSIYEWWVLARVLARIWNLGVQIWNFVYDTQFLSYGTTSCTSNSAMWLFPNARSNRWPHLRIAQKTNNIYSIIQTMSLLTTLTTV